MIADPADRSAAIASVLIGLRAREYRPQAVGGMTNHASRQVAITRICRYSGLSFYWQPAIKQSFGKDCTWQVAVFRFRPKAEID
jgi:hypothetical protein